LQPLPHHVPDPSRISAQLFVLSLVTDNVIGPTERSPRRAYEELHVCVSPPPSPGALSRCWLVGSFASFPLLSSDPYTRTVRPHPLSDLSHTHTPFKPFATKRRRCSTQTPHKSQPFWCSFALRVKPRLRWPAWPGEALSPSCSTTPLLATYFLSSPPPSLCPLECIYNMRCASLLPCAIHAPPFLTHLRSARGCLDLVAGAEEIRVYACT